MTINEASIPNPALQRFSFLVGPWRTEGTHPYFPDTIFHGEATFEWRDGGAFLVMQTRIEEPQIPSGIVILGSDDALNQYFMLYFDERGVSRKYECDVVGNQLRWWRDSSEFSQRFTITVLNDGKVMQGKGEMSRDGGAWEQDLQLTYTRLA